MGVRIFYFPIASTNRYGTNNFVKPDGRNVLDSTLNIILQNTKYLVHIYKDRSPPLRYKFYLSGDW